MTYTIEQITMSKNMIEQGTLGTAIIMKSEAAYNLSLRKAKEIIETTKKEYQSLIEKTENEEIKKFLQKMLENLN
jgi:ribosomal protein L7/L12